MGKGIEIRGRSIRLSFTVEGVRHRPTLMLDGEPLLPTVANVKYANRHLGDIRDAIRHKRFCMAEFFPASGSGLPLTVSEQLDTWLAGLRIEASTRAGYSSAVKFWKATIGKTAVRALKLSDCLTALASRPLLTGKTVNNYVLALRQALDLAVLDKVLTENPAKHIPRAKHQKPPVDPFTAAEAEAILVDMQGHYDAQVANYAEIKFYSGLRTSESFGLRWTNVDLASAEMLVTEGVVRGVEKATTKTNTSRLVQLNSRALAAIVRQKTHTYLAGGHVFHDPRYGTRWGDERAFRRSFWSPTLKRLGIRYRVPYNTRHTYATMMLMAGMTPAFCAGQMGHSVDVFLTTYAKWIPGTGDRAEMRKLEVFLSSDLRQEAAS